jgi:hypothetical protein
MKAGLNILKLGVGAIGSILCLMIMLNSDSSFTFEQSDEAVGSTITTSIYLSLVVMILTVAIMVLFGLTQTLQNINKSKGLIIGLIGFAIVIAISWFGLATDEVFRAYGEGVTNFTSKWVGAGLWATIILGVIAIGTIVYAEVNRIFK